MTDRMAASVVLGLATGLVTAEVIGNTRIGLAIGLALGAILGWVPTKLLPRTIVALACLAGLIGGFVFGNLWLLIASVVSVISLCGYLVRVHPNNQTRTQTLRK
ncbi:hypothetical protein GOEFS_105_00870 [Gordonia effusa NBRC 100432]|uniref:Uncharacterized protein n=1 Tax=Gordonia effusa NBRC 100432 TaxID=1077974 RepID=H0R4S5_9ACTN|nr:hypothetical protein [Gordonia effusa]GAB20076.1 hypothetical protein GOEFS_105_00870 [Gordonia effusa NBRC 100432]